MNEETHKKAIAYIKAKKKRLLEHFAGDNVCKSDSEPVSIFMAGSPGAGKTEFSKKYIMVALEQNAVRIDADEIRDFNAHYDHKNANDIQGASALGVQYIYDYALKKAKNILLDATFANYNISAENVIRSVKRNRYVEIYYLYQEPEIAWNFTKDRELVEGRPVPKEVFIKSFIDSYDNVNKIKKDFGSKIKLNVVVKNFENGLQEFKLNVQSVDELVKNQYNYETLSALLDSL